MTKKGKRQRIKRQKARGNRTLIFLKNGQKEKKTKKSKKICKINKKVQGEKKRLFFQIHMYFIFKGEYIIALFQILWDGVINFCHFHSKGFEMDLGSDTFIYPYARNRTPSIDVMNFAY